MELYDTGFKDSRFPNTLGTGVPQRPVLRIQAIGTLYLLILPSRSPDPSRLGGEGVQVQVDPVV